MLHTHYLASLCQRRSWPEPNYSVKESRSGYACVVRVNNREYHTSKYYPSDMTAREGAALIAFNICRSFSANDGMYPTGFAHGGVIQGNPVPVGAGRQSVRRSHVTDDSHHRYRADSDTSGSRSGGSSPDSRDGSRFLNQTSPDYRRGYEVPATARPVPQYGRRPPQRY